MGRVPTSEDDTGVPIGLRRTPKQARSRARVDAAINALVEMLGDRAGHSISAGDVAERISIPVGSLYEYFEDVASIADAAVARMLDRHDELLRALPTADISSVHEFIDVLFDAYLQLYSDQPAFITLRNSSLWNEQHRRWLSDRVEGFLAEVTSSLWQRRSLGEPAALDNRLSLVFSAADAMLQRIFRDGPAGDALLTADARVALKFMVDRLVASAD
ncbi:MAG: TetR/AcrR family transcriptional regulator [Ilumatobacteraceae bacterium]